MHALFDPRQIPVCGVDTHLPTVAAARLTPQALRQRFAAPPAWQPEVMLLWQLIALIIVVIAFFALGGPALFNN